MRETLIIGRHEVDGASIEFLDAPAPQTETNNRFVSTAQEIARISLPAGVLDGVFRVLPPVRTGHIAKDLEAVRGLPESARQVMRYYRGLLCGIVEADVERHAPKEFRLRSSRTTVEYSAGDGSKVAHTAAQWHIDTIDDFHRWRYVVSLGSNPELSTQFLTGEYLPCPDVAHFLEDEQLPEGLTRMQSASGTVMRFVSHRTIHRANALTSGHRLFFSATAADHDAWE